MERRDEFQAAVRAVVEGDEESLRALLKAAPSLVHQCAEAPHWATLLHYVAANGVEDELQKTPANAPEIARTLLQAGAVPDVYMQAYGRPATALEMLVSSWPPFQQGVQEALVRELVQGGARLEGPASDGRPLTTALVFGYTGAAETLAALGARGDHLFAAAGLGDLQQVRSWFDAEGKLKNNALEGYSPLGPSGTDKNSKDVVQEALHFAVTHGRREVADFLLSRGADTNGRVLGHHCELPLVQALFVHEIGMAKWLLENGAEPDLLDGKRQMTAKEHVDRCGPEGARKILNLD